MGNVSQYSKDAPLKRGRLQRGSSGIKAKVEADYYSMVFGMDTWCLMSWAMLGKY
jgi:hypothetical protein